MMKKKPLLKVLLLLLVVGAMGACNKKTCPAYSQAELPIETGARA